MSLNRCIPNITANGFAHHVVDEIYHDPNNPSGAASRAINAARSILSDPALNLNDTERHRIYNFVTGEIRA